MECDYCGGGDLSFAWSREFTVSEHGWDGIHEYWYCVGCGRGAFVVKEDNGVIQEKTCGYRGDAVALDQLE